MSSYQANSDHTWRCHDQVVPEDWLDRNRHMNMQYYLHLVERGLERLTGGLMTGTETEYDISPAWKFIPGESHIFYRKELFAGQRARVEIRPLSVDGENLRLLARVILDEGDQPLSAECILHGTAAGPDGRATPLPAPARSALEAAVYAGASDPWTPRAFSPGVAIGAPEPDGGWHVSYEGIAASEAAGEDGLINLQGHLQLFERGGMGMFARLNQKRNVFSLPGVGGFALSQRIVLGGRLGRDERYRIRSRAVSLGRKTVSFRHELSRPEEEPGVLASCEHTMAFIDMNRRKTMAVPDLFISNLESFYGVTIRAGEDGGPPPGDAEKQSA